MIERLRSKINQVLDCHFHRLCPWRERFCPWKPKDDQLAGLKWVWDTQIGWREVCDFCNGNCGQCGITGRVGNPGFSLNAIIQNGGWDKGTHAGLAGSPGDLARVSSQIRDLERRLDK